MRIISGKFKGRILKAPPEGTRPTADRAKEMLFDMLSSLLMKAGQRWENLRFADVFSGSGAVGLEAASRGCKAVYLFENNPLAQKLIRQNGGQMTFELYGDAFHPPVAPKAVDVLFMDPPYGKGLACQALPFFKGQGWIDENTLIIIEEDKVNELQIPSGFMLKEKRSAGRNTFYFLKKEE
ncbi:MAG: RsmD family RNA methyltransferase [Alphaproteobacteria bacterium]